MGHLSRHRWPRVTAAELAALLGGAAALVTAFASVLVAIRRLDARINGRMTELLELTRRAAHTQGVLEERGVAWRRRSDDVAESEA